MKFIEASAPGSTMLCGEHAVLHGHSALACAVNKRLSARLTPRNDKLFIIHSDLGLYQSDILNPKIDSRFLFIIQLVKLMNPTHGFELEITSGFSHQVGLGSSAAVTAAVCTCLSIFANEGFSTEHIFKTGLAAIKGVQGRGSGSDLAASVHGGIVLVTPTSTLSCEVERLDCPAPEIGLYFSGYKMKTPEVIELVQKKSQLTPKLYKSLYRLMGETTSALAKQLRGNEMKAAGKNMNFYHGLMDSLGVCDKKLSSMVYSLREHPEVLGAKISGSGLGDCVISLGKPVANHSIGTEINIKIDSEGLIYNVY